MPQLMIKSRVIIRLESIVLIIAISIVYVDTSSPALHTTTLKSSRVNIFLSKIKIVTAIISNLIIFLLVRFSHGSVPQIPLSHFLKTSSKTFECAVQHTEVFHGDVKMNIFYQLIKFCLNYFNNHVKRVMLL